MTPRPQAYPDMGAPAVNPNIQRPPHHQPPNGPFPGTGKPQARRRGRSRAGKIGCLGAIAIVVLLAIFAFTTLQRVLDFGSAISKQSPLSTQTGYMGGSDRVNVLIMGYGGSGHDGANLTDSMAIMSILPQSHHTSLISIPRDLWVQNPPNSGQYSKINSVYATAISQGKSVDEAGAIAAQKASVVTGLKVNYWVTINFTGFRDLINAIGGVDVYVPDSFTSLYPKNDDPQIDASYITIHFDKGNQHMDGETAIRYARARKVTDNLAEGTDFARSARQQVIMKAVLAKIKQVSTWPSLFSAMDAMKHTIYSNLSLADLSEFALHMDLNDPNTAHIGLSNQNVLEDFIASDGEAALRPVNGNWNAITDYINKHLYN